MGTLVHAPVKHDKVEQEADGPDCCEVAPACKGQVLN